MPCIEILQLQIRPHIDPSDPSVLRNMVAVRTALREKVHDTKSRIYQDLSDATLIYIFGSWESLEQHETFSASTQRDEILALQGGQTDFKWLIHIKLDGITIDDFPFDAPVLAIVRLEGDSTGIDGLGVKGVATKTVSGLRCDGGEDVEKVFLSGRIVDKTISKEDMAAEILLSGTTIMYAKNMEA